jgi:hypothetical protein
MRIAVPALFMVLLIAAGDALGQALEITVFEAFAGKRAADRLTNAPQSTRPEGWTLYGRAGLVNFKNQLETSGDTQFGVRRTGPGIAGRVYVGIRRQF